MLKTKGHVKLSCHFTDEETEALKGPSTVTQSTAAELLSYVDHSSKNSNF